VAGGQSAWPLRGHGPYYGVRVRASPQPVHPLQLQCIVAAGLSCPECPRRITRDHLAAQLYPDHTVDEGRKKLSQALYHLQNTLVEAIPKSPNLTQPSQSTQTTATRRSRKVQAGSADLILVTPDQLGLAPNCVVVDAHLFRREAKSAQLADWQRAIQRYRGDLLLEWEPESRPAAKERIQNNMVKSIRVKLSS